MNQSFIERIFPHPPGRQQRQHSRPYDASPTGRTPAPITLRDHEARRTKTNTPTPTRIPTGSTALRLSSSSPSSSTVHPEDPFLPVERAAKALQRNIQAYLDVQSERLAASLNDGKEGQEEDISSLSSSVTGGVAAGVPKTIPIRQPRPKKLSLRGSRKALGRAMDSLAQLKEQELHIIDGEIRSRERGLHQVDALKSRKASLEAAIMAMKEEERAEQEEGGPETAATPKALRSEAANVQAEMDELERRLIELRRRHARLLDQAQQVENAHASRLSSYTSSLALVDKDIAQFLRTPPVPSTASSWAHADDRSTSTSTSTSTTITAAAAAAKANGDGDGGMYALRPDRRTLDMAQEQWTREQEQLGRRRVAVEDERGALAQGAQLWRATVQKIGHYEERVREIVAGAQSGGSGSSGSSHASPESWWSTQLATQLDELVAEVSAVLGTAEQHGWNLLICALGAELEALQQARALLGGQQSEQGEAAAPSSPPARHEHGDDYDDNDEPPADLLNGTATSTANGNQNQNTDNSSRSSNESLRDTLRAFDVEPGPDKGKGKETEGAAEQETEVEADEVDEPTPDFLVSVSHA